MTTLAVNTPRDKVLGDINEIPMVATDIIYEGSAVGTVIGTGHARPLTSVDKFVGFSINNFDNSLGAAAALNVQVERAGSVVLPVTGVTITDINQPVYATDDNAFTMLPTGGVFIGFVRRYVTTGYAEVEFDVGKFVDPYSGGVKETLATSTLTLDAQDNGKFIFVTVDATITLAATATALRNVTLVNMGSFGTVAIVLTPSSGDKIAGANIAPADNASVTNTKVTANRGDLVTLDFGHTDGPCITTIKGTWAAA